MVSALELAPSRQGYRLKERFAKFVNIPELMALFYKVADIQTADMLKLPVPEIMGGKSTTIAVDSSPELKEYVNKFVVRAERIHHRPFYPDRAGIARLRARPHSLQAEPATGITYPISV